MTHTLTLMLFETFSVIIGIVVISIFLKIIIGSMRSILKI